MARQLWLLRHGEAVPHGSRGEDGDRELTERGEAQARAAGAALARLGVEPAACFTSPKTRARDTARLTCAALGVEPVIEQSLADGLDRDGALALARAAGEDRRVLLVGHNPDLPQLVHDLTGARVELKKGGVAGIRLTGRARGELVALLRPRELDRIANVQHPGL